MQGNPHVRFDERDVETSYGRATKAPPDERGGNRHARPTATAPHPDSTLLGHSAIAPGTALPGTKGRWYRDLAAGGPATLEFAGRRLAVQAISESDPAAVARASREYLRKYQPSPYAQAMVKSEVLPLAIASNPLARLLDRDSRSSRVPRWC